MSIARTASRYLRWVAYSADEEHAKPRVDRLLIPAVEARMSPIGGRQSLLQTMRYLASGH